MTSHEHVTAGEMAAFIDHALPGPEHERVSRHLSDCAQCREELAACAALTASAPTNATRWRIGAVLSGAAAAAILAVALRGGVRSREGGQSVERGLAGLAREVRLVAPTMSNSVAARDIRLVWRADSGAVGYHVFLSTAAGSPVWNHDVTDTSATPSDVTFINGGVYNWRVESLRDDGSRAVSRTASFRIIDR